MNQIGPVIDRRLNDLVGKAKNDKEKGEEFEAGYRKACEEIFSLFDEGNIERFVSNNGWTFQRITRQTIQLDEDKLHRVLIENFGEARAKALWRRITKPVVDKTLLAQAVDRGHIPQALANQALEAKTSLVPSLKQWTKEDREKAEIYGIAKA